MPVELPSLQVGLRDPALSVEQEKCLIMSRRGDVGTPLYVLLSRDWILNARALLLNVMGELYNYRGADNKRKTQLLLLLTTSDDQLLSQRV